MKEWEDKCITGCVCKDQDRDSELAQMEIGLGQKSGTLQNWNPQNCMEHCTCVFRDCLVFSRLFFSAEIASRSSVRRSFSLTTSSLWRMTASSSSRSSEMVASRERCDASALSYCLRRDVNWSLEELSFSCEGGQTYLVLQVCFEHMLGGGCGWRKSCTCIRVKMIYTYCHSQQNYKKKLTLHQIIIILAQHFPRTFWHSP